MGLDRVPAQPLHGAARSAMPRNELLDVKHVPKSGQKARRALNRKLRKALEAKQRKAAKGERRIVG